MKDLSTKIFEFVVDVILPITMFLFFFAGTIVFIKWAIKM